jgi:phenylacetate-CoA ligase
LEGVNCKLIQFDDFLKIPVLTKSIVREQGPTLIANNFKQADASSKMRLFQTSGSTGTPMQVYRSASHIFFNRALGLYYHLMHQRNFDFSNVTIVTAKNYILDANPWVSNIQTGPGYIIPIAEESHVIFEHLLRVKPNYIQTHPSTLKRLIDISLELNVKIDSLKEVRTFGELLESNIQRACKTHWNVPLADNYSCEEMGAIGFTCREFGQHHVMTDNVYVEIVDDKDKPCQPGETGRILVTQLQNAAMPLLRYEIGDMGVWGNNCECGRAYPVLKRIEGRRRNLVVLPNGDTFHPVFDEQSILAIADIKRYQIIQKNIENIIIYILGQALTQEQELELTAVFRQSFKHDFTFQFIYQDELPFSERNKFELFKTEVAL